MKNFSQFNNDLEHLNDFGHTFFFKKKEKREKESKSEKGKERKKEKKEEKRKRRITKDLLGGLETKSRNQKKILETLITLISCSFLGHENEFQGFDR